MNRPILKNGRRAKERMPWLRAILSAGLLAIIVNTAMLSMADHLHIVTARGGLLTLLLRIGPTLLPIAKTYAFQQAFHIVVGVGMAVFYVFTFAKLPASALARGFAYALVVWLANACIILPLIGQGFAGHDVLTPLGMIFFAIAHTVFFMLTAFLYHRWHELGG
jgi:hypothetical protein